MWISFCKQYACDTYAAFCLEIPLKISRHVRVDMDVEQKICVKNYFDYAHTFDVFQIQIIRLPHLPNRPDVKMMIKQVTDERGVLSTTKVWGMVLTNWAILSASLTLLLWRPATPKVCTDTLLMWDEIYATHVLTGIISKENKNMLKRITVKSRRNVSECIFQFIFSKLSHLFSALSFAAATIKSESGTFSEVSHNSEEEKCRLIVYLISSLALMFCLSTAIATAVAVKARKDKFIFYWVFSTRTFIL